MTHNLKNISVGGGVATQMCMGPLMCRTSSGQCCGVLYERGRVFCPMNCPSSNNRQTDVAGDQGGYSLADIFHTTLVTTLMFNVLASIGATTTVSNPTTTTTTTTTTTIISTTAPTITTSRLKSNKYLDADFCLCF